jgi:putative glutamine amidotransferase
MDTTQSTVRIGIFGSEAAGKSQVNRHVPLWSVGHAGSVTHAGGVPVEVCAPRGKTRWDDILEEIDGVVFCGFPAGEARNRSHEEDLCHHCREHKLPILAIDNGMLVLNTTFGGTLYEDLAREQPEALQHRHPPEEDVRHAINVIPDTLLCRTYGEGEIIVNSLHRAGIQRLARGFRVGGQALDGVIESIEWEDEDWFAVGIQWQPGSATSSGLDIQIYRALVDAAMNAAGQTTKGRRALAAA